jgi:hypothetical protein
MGDLKAFLDDKLFGKSLAGWKHSLKLVSFLTGEGGFVLVFLESGSFAEDVIGLLEHGAKIDYFRYPTPVGTNTLFGGDGMPGLASGLARARLLLHPRPQLVAEVRQLGTLEETIKYVQGFYDLVRDKLKTSPEELVGKYGAK